MRFPTIKDVAAELRDVNAHVQAEAMDDNGNGGCDVRLQVVERINDFGYPCLKWAIRSGPSDYDQSHEGCWGAGTIPGCVNGKEVRFNSTDLARDLLEQAKEQHAC